MPATVLLYPGAGSDSSHPSLRAIERAVAPVKCVRADFPYRREGRRAPDRAPKLMAAVRQEIATLGRGALVMGGRSMGGRVCSMVAAGADGEPPPAKLAGLVLIAYPLHPPGKPDRLRVEHLPDVRVPCLFVSGTRDPFGSPGELTAWTTTISAPVTHVWIEGGGHDLKGADAAIAEAVATFVTSVLAPASRRPRMR
jgi:predicted alpha/beta-hydrolase family hydrolase